MKRGQGNAKGAAFERYVCKHLSKWVSEGKRDDVFWRTAMSGGRATIGRKVGKMRESQAGDVGAVDALGHRLLQLFFIECKCYRDLGYTAFTHSSGGFLQTFWNEAVISAGRYKRFPLLIARQNARKTIVLVPMSFYEAGRPGGTSWRRDNALALFPNMEEPRRRNSAMMFDFETFLGWDYGEAMLRASFFRWKENRK